MFCYDSGQYKIYHAHALGFLADYSKFLTRRYPVDMLSDTPVIVDVGSHIGVTMTYFKHYRPNAQVMCIEPNREVYEILEKNVEANGYKDVECFNVALSDRDGQAILYGRLHADQETRGNSIMDEWGDRAPFTDSTFVQVMRLSSIMPPKVELLKIDAEGAEGDIIKDLYEMDRLKDVKYIHVEIHETDDLKNLDRIKRYLGMAAFEVTIKPYEMNSLYSNKHWGDWCSENHPKIYELRAINNAYLSSNSVSKNALMMG